MENLHNKFFEFIRHFNITEDFKDDQVFKLDLRGNLQTEEIQITFYPYQQCNIS